MPKISVIIPIYNVEKYLPECLDSVVNQTLKDIEIICVDDCGMDNSIKIAEKYAQNDSRFKILRHSQNKGLGPARNTGLKNASGEYIFFLDSDDYLKEDILEKLYNKIKETNSDIVVSNSFSFTNEKDEYTLNRVVNYNIWLNTDKEILVAVNLQNFINAVNKIPCTAWGKLYSRAFINKNNIGFIDNNIIHEDNGFWIKCCTNLPKIYLITDIGVMYRLRKNAITTEIDIKKNKNKKHKHMKKVLTDVFNYIENNCSPKLEKYFKEQVKNSPVYQVYYYNRIPLLLKYKWLENDKSIYLFGIQIFREKCLENNIKVRKILGIEISRTEFKPI